MPRSKIGIGIWRSDSRWDFRPDSRSDCRCHSRRCRNHPRPRRPAVGDGKITSATLRSRRRSNVNPNANPNANLRTQHGALQAEGSPQLRGVEAPPVPRAGILRFDYENSVILSERGQSAR